MLGRVLGLAPLVWIGKRSYSLYLWHWPIFVYTRPEIDQPLSEYPTLVLRLVLTVAAAELSYRFVEVPIRNGAFTRWRRRLRRRQGGRRLAGPITLAGSSALLLVAVSTVGASGSSGLETAGRPGHRAAGDVAGVLGGAVATGPAATDAPATGVPGSAPLAVAELATTLPPAPTDDGHAAAAHGHGASATRCSRAPRSR